jgi:cytochrome P450
VPVLPLPHLGVVAVTGYDEAWEIYRDTDRFSSCNSVIGPFATFPVPLEGDDISDVVREYRHTLPMHEHLVTMDPPEHTRERGLLSRLITPRRSSRARTRCRGSTAGSRTTSPSGAPTRAPTC